MSLVETVPLTLGTDSASAPAAVTAAAPSILGPAFIRSSAPSESCFSFSSRLFFSFSEPRPKSRSFAFHFLAPLYCSKLKQKKKVGNGHNLVLERRAGKKRADLAYFDASAIYEFLSGELKKKKKKKSANFATNEWPSLVFFRSVRL